MSGHLLFVQKRSVRAGAQVSLARLMQAPALAAHHPAVLLGCEGWLHDHLRETGLPHAVVPFPSPRALTTRLTGYGPFGRAAKKALDQARIDPRVIIANDHQECPLAFEISKRFGGVPVVGIMRTSGLSLRDFQKYQCDRCDSLLAVGGDLHQRIQPWTQKTPTLFTEGFAESEFLQPVPWAAEFPRRILVIGSEDIVKGFTDFIEAIDLIEAEYPNFPALTCDFTGTMPAGTEALAGKPRRATLNMLGRVNGFTALVRSYPLVIHPSREETFGMAPLEAILAGVPTLLSTTGIVGTLNFPAFWQFPPCEPATIAARLIGLWENWPECELDLRPLQDEIRSRFHIDVTSRSLAGEVAKFEHH